MAVKEKNYLAIAKANVTKPSKVKSPHRFLIYSRNKKGKTKFCMTAPHCLVIDPEHGTDRFRRLDPYVWHVDKWEQLDEVWGALRTGRLSPKAIGAGPEEEPFQWVALDGMTRINNLALRYIMKQGELTNLDRRPGMVDRRDYNKSGELIKQLVLNFHALPIGVVYTAQERMYTAESDDSDEAAESSTFFVPDLPQGARGSVNSIVDVIGRLYVVKAQFKDKEGGIVEKNQRRLWVDTHGSYDTGYRSDYELPAFVKAPTVPKLVQLLEDQNAA